MPEELVKMPQNASPPGRTGAGDISERELSRERYTLTSTPPARVQPAHPKKQLYSVPVNKFTARTHAPSPNLERIRSCLEEYRSRGPLQPTRVTHKAASMEDLTPTKRILKGRKDGTLSTVRSPGLRSAAEQRAAERVGRFMLLAAWRRRRRDLHCLRTTLELQVSSSERLRVQVWALKSLLDSDNSKVRLAMKELERLKQLLKDKEKEKTVLEKEKRALEVDVCAAEDRASEMSIGWHNCRNELDAVKASASALERALSLQRAAAADLLAQRDCAQHRVGVMEAELSRRQSLLSSAEAEACKLRREVESKQRALDWTTRRLKMEHDAGVKCEGAKRRLAVRLARARRELVHRTQHAEQLAAQLTEQLGAHRTYFWCPAPLLRILDAAKNLLRYPTSLHEAIIWSLIPARHGC